MAKIKLLMWIVLLGCANRMFGQSVTVDATIDSLQILVGEQAKMRLQVSLDANKRAVFPAFTDTLVNGIEVVDVAKSDTQQLNDGRRWLITQEYTITSFDSALYYIPPVVVKVDDKEYRSKPLALKVYSVPVDTLHPDQFFPPKTVMAAPFEWQDWYVAMACVLLFAPLVWLLVLLIKRIRNDEPIIRRVKVEPVVPPHVEAMQQLSGIREAGIKQGGNMKAYYTELTDVVRTYIQKRYGFNAMEMTSGEIIEHLSAETDAEAMRLLRDLFTTADLVKFAKHLPDRYETDMNLRNSETFVETTKLVSEETDEHPQPTEIKIVEKRPLRTKIILGCVILVIGVALVWSVYYVVSELLNFF